MCSNLTKMNTYLTKLPTTLCNKVIKTQCTKNHELRLRLQYFEIWRFLLLDVIRGETLTENVNNNKDVCERLHTRKKKLTNLYLDLKNNLWFELV